MLTNLALFSILGFVKNDRKGRVRPLGAVHTRFVVGESRTNADNAITKTYGTFYMAFEVDDETLEVVDFSCTHTIDTTKSFLRKVFLGERFPDIDDWLEQTLSERYGGSSRKAVLVAYRDALKRWCSMMED